MKFLLKIVQGPNAGAEIALVEGVRVTLGSADACDIVLADPTLPPEACAIEASADGVVLTPPGAEPESLEPLRVRSFGSTALAVGPADSPWGPLNWGAPAAAKPPEEAGEAAPPESAPPAEADSAASDSTKSEEPEKAGDSPAEAATPSRAGVRRIGYLVLLLLLLVAILVGLRWGWHRFLDKAAPEMLDMAFEVERTEGLLSSIAARYGLTLVETNGTTVVRGDFAARADRLKATAELYEAQPGLALDLADRETLLASASDLLQAATEGAIKIADVTNRVAVLAGIASDPAALAATLDALRADVPRLVGADTAAVTLASPIASAEQPSPLARPSSPAPRLPLCGVLLQPNPCLVLQNGMRLFVGSEVGGYKIAAIAADRITLQPPEGDPVEWTP